MARQLRVARRRLLLGGPLALGLVGCALEEEIRAGERGARPAPTAPPSPGTLPPATAMATPVAPRPLPTIEASESIEEARRLFDQLLQAGEWAAIEQRLHGELALLRVIGTDTITPLGRPAAAHWLKERWQPGIQVQQSRYVEHYGLLELRTGPWRALPPSGPVLQLNAHRYDRSGQASAFGRWVIDTIVV